MDNHLRGGQPTSTRTDHKKSSGSAELSTINHLHLDSSNPFPSLRKADHHPIKKQGRAGCQQHTNVQTSGWIQSQFPVNIKYQKRESSRVEPHPHHNQKWEMDDQPLSELFLGTKDISFRSTLTPGSLGFFKKRIQFVMFTKEMYEIKINNTSIQI